MIKKGIFIVCLLIAMGFSGSAFGSTYYGYSTWGGTWHDANKTGTGDSNLCWAAAASNILDWAGYDTAAYNNETAIFTDFRSHWTNAAGLPKYGWEWYLNGVDSSPVGSDWSHVINLAGEGGNNWPSVPFAGVYHEEEQDAEAMSAVNSFLHSGYGVTLSIYSITGAHTLTCWGFDYDDAGGYQGVWVTDSDDDSENGLVPYTVSFSSINEVWNLSNGRYNGWYIGSVEALARNVTGVPEPATLLLLCFGLLGLASLRKNKIN
jgi:hypothetical protein